MKLKNIICGVAVASAGFSGLVSAAEFRPASVRALGMGGSNIASTNGVDASYWNPAAYGFFGESDSGADVKAVDNSGLSDKDFGLDAGVGVAAYLFGPIAANLDIVQGMQVPNANLGAGLTDNEILNFANFTNDFASLDPELGGINVTADVAIGARVANYGAGIRKSIDVNVGVAFDNQNVGLGGKASAITALTGGAGIDPNAVAILAAAPPGYFSVAQRASINTDLTSAGYTDIEAASVIIAYEAAMVATGAQSVQSAANASALVTLATAPGDLQNNGTTVETRGVALTEVGVTYGYAFDESLSVGGVVKYMQADMVVNSVNAFGSTDVLSNAQDANGSESVTGVGLDLGIMYRLPSWQLGLTAKNLNSPSFEHSSGYVYEMKPQAKVGAAWIPSEEFTVEMGMDLTENEGAVASSKSKYWNVGLEWDAWKVLAIRAGAFENTAQKDIGLVSTIGLGINLWAMRLDLAYAQSSKKVLLENDEIPVYAMASAALAIDF